MDAIQTDALYAMWQVRRALDRERAGLSSSGTQDALVRALDALERVTAELGRKDGE